LGKLEEKKNQSRRKKGIQSSTISHKHFRLFRIFKTTGPVVFKGKDATNADDEPTQFEFVQTSSLHRQVRWGRVPGEFGF